MTNKIQLRRDTTANWERVNPILDDGEPGLNITTNQIKYGDGSTAWNDLPYASGGSGLTDVDGVVTFPGDLLIGTLWPEDPMPGGDKESVVWAKDDTEYLGLWWGGDQTYPDSGYGPVAGIMIGTGDEGGSMTDDFSADPSPADTNITIAINDSTGNTLEWVFDRDGILTFPDGDLTIGTVAGEVQIGTISTDLNILRNGVDGVEIFENEVGFYAGNTKRAQVVPTGLEIISGDLTLSSGSTISDVALVPAGYGFTMSAIELQTNVSTSAVVGSDYITTTGFDYTNFDNEAWYAQIVQAGEAVGPYRSVPVTWAAGSTRSSGFVLVQFTGGNSFGITPAAEGGGSSDPGTWKFPATFGNPSSAVQGGILLTANSNVWKFGTDGNLTIPGEIKTTAGTGAVAVQSNDGSNNFDWNFTTHGSITMPELLSGAQGYGSLDANNNKIALTTGDTVNFAGFSGMILVNTHNGGGVSLYLCGGGSGDAVAIGSSKAGNAVGSMAFNSGIAGYTFTADETGDHVFFAIRTRTGG